MGSFQSRVPGVQFVDCLLGDKLIHVLTLLREIERHKGKDARLVSPGFCHCKHSTLYFWANWKYYGDSNCAQDTRNAHDNKLSFSELGS